MAKVKENGLVYVFYLFIALVFLAGIYVCFMFGYKSKKSPAGQGIPSPSSIVVQKQTLNSPSINLSLSPANSPSGKNPSPSPSGKNPSLSPSGKNPSLSPSGKNPSPSGNDLAKSTTDPSCPNLLVKKGNQLLLYNKNAPEQFGINPKIFNDIDEYIYFVKAERYKNGVDCPILYLQQESNMQGEDVYRIRAGPFDLDFGMPTTLGYSDGFPSKAVPPSGLPLAPVVPTVFPNTTGSMPTTFPSNQSSNSFGIIANQDALKVANTGTFFNNAGITQNNGFGPLAFNQTDASSINNPAAPPLQDPTQLSIIVPQTQPIFLAPAQTQPQIQGQPPIMMQPPAVGPVAPFPQPLVNGQQIIEPPAVGGIAQQPINTNNSSSIAQNVPEKYTDSTRDHPPFNQNQYAGFDPYNQHLGAYTDLDQIHDSTLNQNPTLGLSDNPMDPNWGGIMFTRRQVNSGKYDDNVVTKPIFSGSPNIMTNPNNLVPLVVPIASPGAPSNIQPVPNVPGQNVPLFNPMRNNGSAQNPPNPPFTNPMMNGIPANPIVGENTRTNRNSPDKA